MKVTTEKGLTYQVDIEEVMPWISTAMAASDMTASQKFLCNHTAIRQSIDALGVRERLFRACFGVVW